MEDIAHDREDGRCSPSPPEGSGEEQIVIGTASSMMSTTPPVPPPDFETHLNDAVGDLPPVDASDGINTSSSNVSGNKRTCRPKWLTPGLMIVGVVILMSLIAGVASGLSSRYRQEQKQLEEATLAPTQEDPAEDSQWCGDGVVGNRTCQNGSCCSGWGWCGFTDDHCTNGQELPEDFFRTDRFCGNGIPGNGTCEDSSLCCSPEAKCELSYFACGGWWFETDRGVPCGQGLIGDGICEDEAECCSPFGYCGSTSAYCGLPDEGDEVDEANEKALSIVALFFGATAVLCSIIATISTVVNREKPAFKIAQIEFLYMLHGGLLLISVGALVGALSPSFGICLTTVWLVNVGYSLELVPLLVKTVAINRMMAAGRRMRRVVHDKTTLFKSVLQISSLVLIYLILWTVLDPPTPDEEMDTNKSCTSMSDAWWIISTSWQFILLCASALLAFKNRNYREDLSDSRTLATMIYSHFIFLILRLITHVLDGEATGFNYEVVRSMLISIDAIATICIYFLPKLLAGTTSNRHLSVGRMFISGSFQTTRSRFGLSIQDDMEGDLTNSRPLRGRRPVPFESKSRQSLSSSDPAESNVPVVSTPSLPASEHERAMGYNSSMSDPQNTSSSTRSTPDTTDDDSTELVNA